MCCLPFCCCIKNFSPKVLAIIALVCNIIKLIITSISLFALIWAIVASANALGIIELIFNLVHIINIIIILWKIANKNAFGISNKTVKVLCIVSMVLSGFLLLFGLITLIILIALASEIKNASFWGIFIVIYILILANEVIHFLAIYYLYRLLDLKADCSYSDYLKKGSPVGQNTTVEIKNEQNLHVFPQSTPNNITIQVPQTNTSNTNTG